MYNEEPIIQIDKISKRFGKKRAFLQHYYFMYNDFVVFDNPAVTFFFAFCNSRPFYT